MMPWLLSALGLVILLLAGDALVKGAVNLSLRVGIPALIVSLTVVAFGTSAPELLISVNAILDDKPGLALGNVVGSNTANILLVLGIPAILAVLHTSSCRCSKSYLQMLAASILFILLAFRGTFDWISGLILLAALALMLGDAFRDTMAHRRAAAITALSEADGIEDVEGADPNMPWWQIITFLVLGLVGLPLGADILVDNASILATTVMAALRKQADVALGNVIGSNMFNLLGIIGVAALVGEIPVDPQFLNFDLWVMLGTSLLIIPFVFFKIDITRVWGIALTSAYVVYVSVILI
jgi:cation:H+ antiporter